MKELLARAISELPEKERQVLALYYYQELTMKEVGSVLGVGESRVSQIHSMAVIRLRALLSEMNREVEPPELAAGAAGGD
jgi:RNA polymerase sigma factor for flagellar operon FliA